MKYLAVAIILAVLFATIAAAESSALKESIPQRIYNTLDAIANSAGLLCLLPFTSVLYAFAGFFTIPLFASQIVFDAIRESNFSDLNAALERINACTEEHNKSELVNCIAKEAYELFPKSVGDLKDVASGVKSVAKHIFEKLDPRKLTLRNVLEKAELMAMTLFCFTMANAIWFLGPVAIAILPTALLLSFPMLAIIKAISKLAEKLGLLD